MLIRFTVLVTVTISVLVSPAVSSESGALISKYPWLVKSQTEMSFSECKNAMRHDSNYWWAKGKCHMKFIRYAAGVVTDDVPAAEDPNAVRRQGDLLTAITQYRPSEGLYCEHGGYCYSAEKIRLLGSVRLGPDNSGYKIGDESDHWERVGTSCELILKDLAAIKAAGALELLEGCH